MWNSFRTDARIGLTAEVITIPGGNGDEIHAWFARPTGDAPAPGNPCRFVISGPMPRAGRLPRR